MTTTSPRFLSGPRLFLRPLEMGDLDRLRRWHNDAELYQSLLGTCWPSSRGAVEEWLRRKMEHSTSELNLAICVSETEEHIGNIYLRDLDWVARRGEIHIFLGEATSRGRGFGREAIEVLCRHAFSTLGLGRIYLFVLAENMAAIRAYENAGFQREGLLRKHAYKGGRECDVVAMGRVERGE